MPDAELGRDDTAHVEGELSNGSPVGELDRATTGRVRGRLTISGPGD